MTTVSPMTRNELIELAALDAFGLLDEYEAALYTRSFHHAPATVQDEILEVQAKIVADPEMLPVDLPPDDLRQKVLDRVAVAVDAESPDFAPLATIGRSRSLRSGGSSVDSPVRHRAVVSRQFWRAAVFVLAASLVVVGYYSVETISQAQRISLLALYDLNSEQLEQLLGGTTVGDILFDPAMQHVALLPTDEDANYHATVLTIEGSATGVLLIKGLPSGSDYELSVRDAAGALHTVKTFESLQRRGGIEFTLASNITLGANVSWEIHRDGELLLASA